MLVHKGTMGVVGEFWAGEFRKTSTGPEPVLRPARLADFPYLVPEDWWEVPDGTSLARQIRLHYPWIEPVVDEGGQLAAVTLLQTPEQLEVRRREEERLEQLRQAAAVRGYQNPGRLRPLGIFGFLKDRCTPPSHNGAVPSNDRGVQPCKIRKKENEK